MKRVVFAFVALAAMTAIAAAADLARRAPSPYYPAQPAIVQIYNWTGFHVGINGGGGFGSSNWDSTGSRDVSGGLIGGTAGYNYQFGQVVAGIEGDIDWSGINGSTTNLCPPGCKTSNTWLATVRGRLGYAADRFMPYITGGAAFGNIKASVPGFAQTSSDNSGWTIGAGLCLSGWLGRRESRDARSESVQPRYKARMRVAPAFAEAEIAVTERATERDLADIGQATRGGRERRRIGFKDLQCAGDLAGLMIEPFLVVMFGRAPSCLVNGKNRGVENAVA
jgi:outer membrane immunogenic protein